MLSAVSRSRNKVDEHSQWWKCDLSPRYEMYYLAIFTFCHCFHKHLCVKYLQSTNLTHFQWKKECWFMIICFVYLLKIVIKTSQGNYSLKQNFKKDFIYLFLERGEGREKEREKNIDADQLPLIYPQPGTWPTTQACALTGNRTSDLSVCRPVLNPVSHTSQGSNYNFNTRLTWI